MSVSRPDPQAAADTIRRALDLIDSFVGYLEPPRYEDVALASRKARDEIDSLVVEVERLQGLLVAKARAYVREAEHQGEVVRLTRERDEALALLDEVPGFGTRGREESERTEQDREGRDAGTSEEAAFSARGPVAPPGAVRSTTMSGRWDELKAAAEACVRIKERGESRDFPADVTERFAQGVLDVLADLEAVRAERDAAMEDATKVYSPRFWRERAEVAEEAAAQLREALAQVNLWIMSLPPDRSCEFVPARIVEVCAAAAVSEKTPRVRLQGLLPDLPLDPRVASEAPRAVSEETPE